MPVLARRLRNPQIQLFLMTYTYTNTLEVDPTITPTASPVSATTRTYTYMDLEIVSVFLPAGAVKSSDLAPTTTKSYVSGVVSYYAVAYTMTAPSSCPTSFEVVTQSVVYVPAEVWPYLSIQSTATSVHTRWDETYITYFIEPTAVAPSERPDPTSNWDYSYYVRSCRNPTATGAAYWGPGSSSGSDYDDWDWSSVCSAYTGCVKLATWVIVIATIIPTLFLLGFLESYFWFRRLMLGKTALRLGTISWCLISLWFILLTRKADSRSPEDQALMRNYWKSLSFGTRIKLWFKHGFRWRYPVELLGNPDGTTVVVVPQPPADGTAPAGQFPPPPPGSDPSAAATVPPTDEKATQAQTQEQQQQQPPYPAQPYPGQQPPQGYMWIPAPPQNAYVAPGSQPVVVPQYPPPPSVSPVPTTGTPPPPVYGQQPPPPPPGTQQQQ
ncbi:hypothetical protein VTJ49DRAFT_5647 [Mycothermus thermophilus]|uniref:Uncharacterized protein n=1 Tax=Humicola insolens TaxID=85995 RepID=A0ABR3VK93_HUMIN